MLPYQKYPSIYKQSSQDYSNPPQSPFDIAYGSSLLPRQLLVSSPYIQVPTPLTSPYSRHPHHPHHPHSNNSNGGYFIGPPVPQLNLPPRRNQYNQRYSDYTPSKKPILKHSSTTTNSSISDDDLKEDLNEDKDLDELKISRDQLESTSISSNLYNSTNSSNSIIQFNNNFKNPTRSILLSNLNPNLSITEFLNNVKFGPIENIKLLINPSKNGLNSIILTFLKVENCFDFFKQISSLPNKFKRLFNNSNHLSISFINTRKLLHHISIAVDNDGATRNVFIGDLNNLKIKSEINEEFLLKEFKKFGTIEKIDIIEKESSKSNNDNNNNTNDDNNTNTNTKDDIKLEKCAFIHFTNIASAIKTVEQLNLNPIWSNTSNFYGTDRCCSDQLDDNNNDKEIEEDEDPIEIDEESNFNNESILNNNDNFNNNDDNNNDDFDNEYIADDNEFYLRNEDDEYDYFNGEDDESFFLHQQQQQTIIPRFRNFHDYNDNLIQNRNHALSLVQNLSGGSENSGNRTICLSNLDPLTSVENICNVVRGGILQKVKILPDKKVCFITFIDSSSATQFFAQHQLVPITLNGRRLRIGWGNNPGPLPTKIALAVTIGASRNIYIGIKKDDDNNNKDSLNGEVLSLPNEEDLRKDFEQFGEIEQINYFKNNSCVFLNFFNIDSSIRLISQSTGLQSKKFHDHFNGKYSNFKISYAKDRCGNPSKKKKKKRSKKRSNKILNNISDSSIIEEEEEEEDDEQEEVEENNVPSELFASMGITKKNEEKKSKKEVESVDAFGISTNNNKTQDSIKEEVEKEKENDEESEDDDDDDDVEIITQREDSEPNTSINQNSRRPSASNSSYKKNNKSNYSRSSSRNSSRVSLNSYYNDFNQYAYNQQQYAPPQYHHPQFYQIRPPATATTQSSPRLGPHRTVSSSSLNKGRNNHNHNHNHHLNSTNGSQVMAQYLQQSQHANLFYAANVLSVVDGNEPINDFGYYGNGGYQKRGGHR